MEIKGRAENLYRTGRYETGNSSSSDFSSRNFFLFFMHHLYTRSSPLIQQDWYFDVLIVVTLVNYRKMPKLFPSSEFLGNCCTSKEYSIFFFFFYHNQLFTFAHFLFFAQTEVNCVSFISSRACAHIIFKMFSSLFETSDVIHELCQTWGQLWTSMVSKTVSELPHILTL